MPSMQASIVIPLWNGADVIADCLAALYAHAGDGLAEVICVDNASADGSAEVVAGRFGQVRLLRQPVNLGFAGGVNAGIAAARGDLFVLLNQDCLVQRGWLAALSAALAAEPRYGIAGCTVYHADGSLDHAGAIMTRPAAYGVHLTDRGDDTPRAADYVTGAAFAIRRSAWEAIGPLDDEFYPAYYEEADYCYRARRLGIETAYVPAAAVVHLRSSREAGRDPLRHWANQHRSRYRFVSKHWQADELTAFFAGETAALAAETAFVQAAGRALAARDTLRSLPEIVQRRQLDLGDDLGPVGRRHLQVGFTGIWRAAFAAAERLCTAEATCSVGRARVDERLTQRHKGTKVDDFLGVFVALCETGARIFRAGQSDEKAGDRPTAGGDAARGLRARPDRLRRAWEALTCRRSSRREASSQSPGISRLALLEALTDYDYR